MTYIVGAYAASPTAASWDPTTEAAYFASLAAIPGLRGLELPFAGTLHRDEDWLLSNLDPSWDLVITAIPGTVGRNTSDPDFGLASPVERGRRAALDFTADLRAGLRRINDHLGRRAVIAVELHSAPRTTRVASALRESLEEIAGWDWDGTALSIEHCDAARPGQTPQKGYLSLAEELDAVKQVDGIVGVTVNWARSAIEGRRAATAAEHIAQAVAADALTGLMFSGVADRPGRFGEAWLDAHLPPSAGDDPAFADLDAVEPTSILGPAQIAQALRAAGDAPLFTGVKIAVRPAELSLEARIAYLRDAVSMVDRARSFHHVAKDEDANP
jgi:hypothetical protein